MSEAKEIILTEWNKIRWRSNRKVPKDNETSGEGNNFKDNETENERERKEKTMTEWERREKVMKRQWYWEKEKREKNGIKNNEYRRKKKEQFLTGMKNVENYLMVWIFDSFK